MQEETLEYGLSAQGQRLVWASGTVQLGGPVSAGARPAVQLSGLQSQWGSRRAWDPLHLSVPVLWTPISQGAGAVWAELMDRDELSSPSIPTLKEGELPSVISCGICQQELPDRIDNGALCIATEKNKNADISMITLRIYNCLGQPKDHIMDESYLFPRV